MQPAHQQLKRSIAGHRSGFCCRFEMLVEQCVDAARLALKHVEPEKFGGSRPIVECHQPESHCAILTIRTTIERSTFKLSLVFTQTRNDLANSIQVVPAILAEKTDPALEETIQ